MHGFVMQFEEKEPKWEESRTRINRDCVKVSMVNVNALTIIDPKGDFELIAGDVFYSNGQLPFGEWFKKLKKSDASPRGDCSDYFSKNASLRC